MKPGTRIELTESVQLPDGEVVVRGELGWVVRGPRPDCWSGQSHPHAVVLDDHDGVFECDVIREHRCE